MASSPVQGILNGRPEDATGEETLGTQQDQILVLLESRNKLMGPAASDGPRMDGHLIGPKMIHIVMVVERWLIMHIASE